jgi:hypothetical protein
MDKLDDHNHLPTLTNKSPTISKINSDIIPKMNNQNLAIEGSSFMSLQLVMSGEIIKGFDSKL